MAERDLIIRLLGDASSLIRSVRSSSTQLKAIGVSAQSSARLQIEASLKKDARLRQEALAYRAAASAAVRGSREQVVAANLADRANAKLARSLGVTSAESRAFARSASTAERDLGRATRGALAGSGVFRGLGRSIAFASGGFLAFASAGQFVRTSIDAAKDAEVTQRQLGAQFRASGKNLSDYQSQIDSTNLKLSALSGFTKDDLDKSFTTIFRTTGNVSKALRDVATAADIARGKKIGLSAATLIEAKAEGGNLGILRRAGIQVSKNATVEQALATVRAKFAGQAAAGTTQQERFGAVLHDSEVIIGAGLLPTLNQYLASGAQWLSQMNESGRLQKDVARASSDLRGAIKGVRDVVSPLVSVLRILGRVSGGTENEVKLLGGAFLVLEGRAKLIKWGFIAAGEGSVGSAAEIASLKVGGLAGALSKLSKLGPIAIAIALDLIPKSQKKGAISDSRVGKDFANLPVVGGLFSQANRLSDAINNKLGITSNSVAGSPLNPFAPSRFGSGDLGLGALTPAQKKAISTATTTPRGISLQGQFNLLELRKANAEQSNNQKIVRAILVSEEGILKAQESSAKKLKDRTGLAQSLAGVMDQIRGIDQASASAAKQSADAQKQAAAAAKKRLQDQRKAVQEALQGRQFRALGLDADGSPLTPGTKALRRELGNVDKAISGTFLDTSKTQSVLSKIRRVLSGGLGAVAKDVRSQIKSMLDDLDQQLKDSDGGPRTKFVKTSGDKILAGLGLSAEQLRVARQRLATVGVGGTVPSHGFVGALGTPVATGGVTITGPVHFHGVQNPKQMADALDRYRSSRAGTRRGSNAGH